MDDDGVQDEDDAFGEDDHGDSGDGGHDIDDDNIDGGHDIDDDNIDDIDDIDDDFSFCARESKFSASVAHLQKQNVLDSFERFKIMIMLGMIILTMIILALIMSATYDHNNKDHDDHI